MRVSVIVLFVAVCVVRIDLGYSAAQVPDYWGLFQLQMALLLPDDSLLHFSQLKISFINQNETSFSVVRYCHQTLCFHLMECGQLLLHIGRAHACRAKLLRSWVRIPPGAGLFSSLLYPISSVPLIQIPHIGATLLIFL